MKIIKTDSSEAVNKLQEYSSLQELAEAYAKYSNASYENVDKHWTTSDVIEFFVKNCARYVMKYLYKVDSHAYVIKGFGYVKNKGI